MPLASMFCTVFVPSGLTYLSSAEKNENIGLSAQGESLFIGQVTTANCMTKDRTHTKHEYFLFFF